MASVEMWQTEHEKVCADRYRLLLAVIGVGGSIILGASGWGLNKVFDNQHEQMVALQQVSAQVQAKP